MNNIQKIITENFQKNITYIEKEHHKLFQKLSALDNAVANGHYKEKYELVFENESFDVLEKSTHKFLYNKQLEKHTLLSTDAVNFKIDNNMFEGFFKHSYTTEMLQEFQKVKKESPLRSHLGYTTPITHFTQQETKKREELYSLDKFIFFGIGLGTHLLSINKKIGAKVYLLVEDDIELFRLSLFTIDYTSLAENATLFFSIFEDDTEFSESCDLFLSEKYYFNHYIKYFQLLSHSEEKANKFYISLLNQPHLQFFFNDYMHIMLKPLEYFSQNYKTIQLSFDFQEEELKDKPILMIASGPSLQNNIQWLKENKDNFIIIAVSSSLKFLINNEIIPNIVLHLDPFDASLKSFEILENSEKLQESIFFMAASSPSNVMQLLKKENTYLYETSTAYNHSALSISGACVGSITYQLLLILKIEEIYLLGLDLAVDQKTGKDHTDVHQSTKQFTLKNDLLEEKPLDYKENLFEIQGNFKEKVFTTPHFYSSVDVINRYFSQLQKPFQKVYNLSDGAFFKGTTPLQALDIEPKKVQITNSNQILKDILDKHSKTNFTENDKEKLKLKLQHATKLQDKLIKYEVRENQTAQEYAKNIYHMFIQEESLKDYELTRVLDAYLYFVLHFVYDYLNSKESSYKNFQQMHQILKKELLSIIEYYIKKLQFITKEIECKI